MASIRSIQFVGLPVLEYLTSIDLIDGSKCENNLEKFKSGCYKLVKDGKPLTATVYSWQFEHQDCYVESPSAQLLGKVEKCVPGSHFSFLS